MPKNLQTADSNSLPVPKEVLADVLALRRKVYFGVYFAVYLALIAYVPLGFSPGEIVLVGIVSTLIAGFAIHLSFQRIIRANKRASYPLLLMAGVSEAHSVIEGGEHALAMAECLLGSQSSFVALTNSGSGYRIGAIHGIDIRTANDRLEQYASLIDSAVKARYPLEVASQIGDIREVIVPILAGSEPQGALYCAGYRSSADLRDKRLLSDIGNALGAALAGLRSRELLLQQEARLRTVIAEAPIVLFSIGRTGAITFMQGQGMARWGITTEQMIGRQSDDVFGAYPQLLHSIRRAFAGEEIEATITIGINEQQVTYEYRLAPERDEIARVIGIIGVATDVTDRKRTIEALSESQRVLETLVSNLPGFAYRCRNDQDWTMEYISAGVADLTGYAPAELTAGQPTFNDMIHPDDRESVWQKVQGAVDAREKYLLEYRLIARDGNLVWVWEHGQAIFDEDGEVVALEGFISDVTERKRAEHELLASEERYRDLFENARDAVYTYDRRGRLVEANDRWSEMTGYSSEELMKVNMADLVAPEYQPAFAEGLLKSFRGDGLPYEMEVLRKDGSRLPIEAAIRVVLSEQGTVKWVQGIVRDVSERRQAEDTIRRLAYNDPLTDLPNRAMMEDRLTVALAQARREQKNVAVMFIDLDHFKVVNDTLGHGAGDHLLQAVARDLGSIVRDGDTVARVGGDEFTVILPLLERIEDATEIAGRILDALRSNRTIETREFRITGSIGITAFPEDGEDAATLLRNADTAMYRAKEHGRDNYQHYTPAMNFQVLERHTMENDLNHAIERNELTVFYQPIIDTGNGSLRGAEALLRWNHPERGSVPPDRFIPFAEETGQIVPIGEWVLRRACEQLRDWTEEGFTLERMAINLSARQLREENLVERITGIVAETGVSPHALQLEITEGAVLRDEDRSIAALEAIRRMGVGIALDDFGTGYSSLTYLKRFPVDTVKIDRSFVRDLERDPNDAAIVSTVIAMAQSLRLNVIAEGVETEGQLAFLRDRRCGEFQGYLKSAPVPPEDFEVFLRSPVATLASSETRQTNVA